jgi:hypothetical protein
VSATPTPSPIPTVSGTPTPYPSQSPSETLSRSPAKSPSPSQEQNTSKTHSSSQSKTLHFSSSSNRIGSDTPFSGHIESPLLTKTSQESSPQTHSSAFTEGKSFSEMSGFSGTDLVPRECIFVENKRHYEDEVLRYKDNCMIIRNCIFIANKIAANDGNEWVGGGSIHLVDSSVSSGSEISGCIFIECFVEAYLGVCAYISAPYSVLINNNCAHDCFGYRGGFMYLDKGIFICDGNSLYNCSTPRNDEDQRGGCFYFGFGVSPKVVMTNSSKSDGNFGCVFYWDMTISDEEGGELMYCVCYKSLGAIGYALSRRCNFSECIFIGNENKGNNSECLIWASGMCHLTFDRCLFKDNDPEQQIFSGSDESGEFIIIDCYSDIVFLTGMNSYTFIGGGFGDEYLDFLTLCSYQRITNGGTTGCSVIHVCSTESLNDSDTSVLTWEVSSKSELSTTKKTSVTTTLKSQSTTTRTATTFAVILSRSTRTLAATTLRSVSATRSRSASSSPRPSRTASSLSRTVDSRKSSTIPKKSSLKYSPTITLTDDSGSFSDILNTSIKESVSEIDVSPLNDSDLSISEVPIEAEKEIVSKSLWVGYVASIGVLFITGLALFLRSLIIERALYAENEPSPPVEKNPKSSTVKMKETKRMMSAKPPKRPRKRGIGPGKKLRRKKALTRPTE